MANGNQNRVTQQIPFEYITDNPYFTVIFSTYMFTALYLSMGTEARAGPESFTIYILATVITITLAVNETRKRGGDFDTFIRVLGLDQPLPGYNFLMGVMGIGIAIWVYQFAAELASIAPGNVLVTSAAFPLYNPYTAFPNEAAVSLTLVDIAAVSLYHFVVVAPNEEIWVLTMAKNLSNWLSRRGFIKDVFFTIFGAIIASRLIWISWHWFSWEGLTAASIIMGLSYGIIFYTPYFITDYIGLLTPDQPVTLVKLLIPAAITSHGMWNTLVTIGGLGLGFAGNMITGGVLVVASVLGMYWIRQVKTP